ncbi:unnamed protein product [Leptosia nina]|uniref:Uncharacterized protein n=1 Tax=Leptosia nina TaxID=320188 RepID=A0AAV1IWK3_9NEOP
MSDKINREYFAPGAAAFNYNASKPLPDLTRNKYKPYLYHLPCKLILTKKYRLLPKSSKSPFYNEDQKITYFVD